MSEKKGQFLHLRVKRWFFGSGFKLKLNFPCRSEMLGPSAPRMSLYDIGLQGRLLRSGFGGWFIRGRGGRTALRFVDLSPSLSFPSLAALTYFLGSITSSAMTICWPSFFIPSNLLHLGFFLVRRPAIVTHPDQASPNLCLRSRPLPLGHKKGCYPCMLVPRSIQSWCLGSYWAPWCVGLIEEEWMMRDIPIPIIQMISKGDIRIQILCFTLVYLECCPSVVFIHP